MNFAINNQCTESPLKITVTTEQNTQVIFCTTYNCIALNSLKYGKILLKTECNTVYFYHCNTILF